MSADLINAWFEFSAGLFIMLSILKLHREKLVRGISTNHVAFFWTWGAWNIYYYPHLDQYWSLLGAMLVLAFNTVWTSQIIYYNWKEKHP